MKLLKKIFNRKDKRRINDPNDINTVISIPHYAPNAGVTPREYMLSEKLIALEEVFPMKCKEFLKKAKADENNGSYMDGIIQAVEQEAKDLIFIQRNDHRAIIMHTLNDIHIGDRIRCEEKLKQHEEELDETKKELSMMKKIYYRGTSYEEFI